MSGIGLLVLLALLRNGLYRAISILGVVVSRFARTHRWWTSFDLIRLRWEEKGVKKRVHEAPCKEPVLRRRSQLLEQQVRGVHTDFCVTVIQNQRNLDFEADSEGHFGPSFQSQTPFRGVVFWAGGQVNLTTVTQKKTKASVKLRLNAAIPKTVSKKGGEANLRGT